MVDRTKTSAFSTLRLSGLLVKTFICRNSSCLALVDPIYFQLLHPKILKRYFNNGNLL